MRDVQKRIDEINKVFDGKFGNKSVMHYVLKIGEEYGELCDAILSEDGMQRGEKVDMHTSCDVKNELADVVLSALVLARRLDFDVDDLLESKLDFVEKRVNNEPQ